MAKRGRKPTKDILDTLNEWTIEYAKTTSEMLAEAIGRSVSFKVRDYSQIAEEAYDYNY